MSIASSYTKRNVEEDHHQAADVTFITELVSNPIQKESADEEEAFPRPRSKTRRRRSASMILVLFALAIFVSDLRLGRAAKAYIADLLPDLQIATISPGAPRNGVQYPLEIQRLPRRPAYHPMKADFETKPGHSYTLLLMEEEGDLRWLLVNAHDEDLTNGDVVVKYSSLPGRRRYVFVVFDQGPLTVNASTAVNMTRDIRGSQLNLKTFSTGFGFEAPLAVRSFVAKSRTAPCPDQARKRGAVQECNGTVTPGVPCFLGQELRGDFSANNSVLVARLTRDGILPHFLDAIPRGIVHVDYGRGRVIEMGKFFIAQYLWILPLNVSFDTTPGSLYTLFLTDITVQFWQHWMIVNIGTRDVYGGDEVLSYSGPFPTTGTRHTLVFLVYSQGGRQIDVEGILTTDDSTLDPRLFAKEHELGDPVAFNYFLCRPESDETKAQKIHTEEAPWRAERLKEIEKRRKTKVIVQDTPVVPLPERAPSRSGARTCTCTLTMIMACIISGFASKALFTE